MNEVLLQMIVEKLETLEIALSMEDKAGKNNVSFREQLKILQEDIKKLPELLISNREKADKLQLSLDNCYNQLQQPLQSRIEHSHHLHKGIWVSAGLLLICIILSWSVLDLVNIKKQYEANYIKYRMLKVAGGEALLKVLYHADSLYILNSELFRKNVELEEQRIISK